MKVKALRTIHGYYGTLEEGNTKEVEAGTANELVKAGLVEIVDSKSTPVDEPKQGTDMTALKNTKTKARK